MRWQIILITLLLMVFPFSLLAQEKNPDEFPVISYRNLEVKEFNIQIIKAEKNREEWVFSPISIATRFHKLDADARFADIKQKNDRAECPLNSVVTIVEEGFLDDQMRGRWTQFHLGRKDCTKAWKIKDLKQAYLCGIEGSKKEFLKDICPKEKSGKVTDLWVKMEPTNAKVPCDYFPYTFDVKFKITVDGPIEVTFQRMRSDGSVAPTERVVFSKAGTKGFDDYYRVGKPGTYWFRVNVISPNPVVGESSSKVECHERR